MPINWSEAVYKVCQDVFAVPITIHPIFSQPDGSSYEARGIYTTDDVDILTEDGGVYSDQRTICDIRTAEFAILPQQKDRITIPFDSCGVPLGEFEIVDTNLNGGGEMTLEVRKWLPEPRIAEPSPRTGYLRREER